jgi:hypothetical protein
MNGATAPLGWCAEHPSICTAGTDIEAILERIPAVAASALLLNIEGDNQPTAQSAECLAEWTEARSFCSVLMSDPKRLRRSPNVWGGSFDRCVRGQVSQRCGGNKVE